MEDRINQALMQIEEDLQGIKSAREQVESVVTSSSQLQEKVGAFVKDVTDFSQQVEKISQSFAETRNKDVERFKDSLGKLDKSCDDALSQMEKRLEKVIEVFEEKIKTVNQTIDKNEKTKLESFNKSIDSLNTSCKEAVSLMQDASSGIVSEFDNKTSAAVDSIKNEVQLLHAEVENLILAKNELVSSIETIKDLRDKIEKLMTELKESQSAQDEELKIIKKNTETLSSASVEMSKSLGLIDKKIENNKKDIDLKFIIVYIASFLVLCIIVGLAYYFKTHLKIK